MPELVRAEGEPLVDKGYGDALEGADLERLLAQRGIGHLVVTGAQTDACIRSMLHGAFTRGYDVTLVTDGHTTSDRSAHGAPSPEQVVAHTNMYWAWHAAPGRTAAALDAAAVSFAAAIEEGLEAGAP